MDCFNGILCCIGPGDHQLLLPPGSKEYKLELSNSGHWMLPVMEYNDRSMTGQGSSSSSSNLNLLHSTVA